MDTIIFWAFAVAYVALIILLGVRHKKVRLSSVLFLVLIALVYDNLMINSGRFIGKGDLLQTLNFGRFWLHALFTPTLIIFSIAILQEASVAWVNTKVAITLTALLFLVAIVIEFMTELNGLTLAPTEAYGALSYSSVEETTGPPFMILVMLIALLIAACTLTKLFQWWWMLIGAIVMTIGSAVPIDIQSNAITNLFELFLLFTLVLTQKHFNKQNFI